jgi:hypothetical protein
VGTSSCRQWAFPLSLASQSLRDVDVVTAHLDRWREATVDDVALGPGWKSAFDREYDAQPCLHERWVVAGQGATRP